MKTIEIFKMFNSDTLRNRSSALLIVKKILSFPDSEVIVIDFNNVVFISRSFCHGLLSGIANRRKVSFTNTNTEIERMIRISPKKPNYSFNNHIEEVEVGN